MDIFEIAEKNADLSCHTTFGLPGRAEYLFVTSDPEELYQAVAAARAIEKNYFIIAGGSNIVVPAQDYQGLVIVYRERKENKKEGSLKREGNKIIVNGSVSLWSVVDFAIANGLSGLENLAGIPGTIGGAVYGNAGAYGHSVSEVVDGVIVFDGEKKVSLSRDDCCFSYRHSVFKEQPWVILSVVLELVPGDGEALRKYADSLLSSRGEKFSNIKCPGSFFKNVLVKDVSPESLEKVDQTKIIDSKIPAGYLLENVGAKGMTLGGLKIADYHGNLIINTGTATARDVVELVTLLKQKVKDMFGIELEEEVRYLS
jgi:UDP-N-acetylmuramate dehydrogenase